MPSTSCSAHAPCTAVGMSGPGPLSASVLICTYNRAAMLGATLESLRHLHASQPWDIVIVDNNSSDDTRAVVEAFATTVVVPVEYIFEPTQGKSHALNTGI